jgi:hypothetical protein
MVTLTPSSVRATASIRIAEATNASSQPPRTAWLRVWRTGVNAVSARSTAGMWQSTQLSSRPVAARQRSHSPTVSATGRFRRERGGPSAW